MLQNKERRNDFHENVYTIGKERIYVIFSNCALEINDVCTLIKTIPIELNKNGKLYKIYFSIFQNYIGGFMRCDIQMIGLASSVEINFDNSVKVYFIPINPKKNFIDEVQYGL